MFHIIHSCLRFIKNQTVNTKRTSTYMAIKLTSTTLTFQGKNITFAL